ncbi:peptidylprolyl isomerase [Clostridiaceae bacterium AF42-6]|nr:peptidylprolyl isomerase [Clostridiaceae bacterium AF42-6]RHP51404.1 peptidylprolyl isomerase [Clostridiaceae bacterium AF31-3BH]RHQ25441.1 peptidylprolyl isomerase [Clostridiaceae bacterium AF29-16BH]
MKKITVWLLTLAFAATMLAGCGSKTDTTETTETTEATSAADETSDGAADTADTSENEELLTGLHHVTIDVQDYGTISLELDADTAPISVTNFINLANEGFYDGLTFHRIISGFMIQGGDPNGNGTGGSEKTIKGEFSANGVENDISHVRGVISMARANDPDSGSSQFFIVHEDSTFLDGQYAAFGHVTDGMDVVDAICEAVPVQDNNGTVAAADQPVITAVTVVD